MTSLVVVDVLVLKYVLAFLASEGRSTASTMKCLLAAFLLQIKACGQIFKRTFDKNFSQDHNCSKENIFSAFAVEKRFHGVIDIKSDYYFQKMPKLQKFGIIYGTF